MKLQSTLYNVGYPIYGAKFINEKYLLTAGGGGEGANGIPNKITVLKVNFAKPAKPVKKFRELSLDDTDDSPTCLDFWIPNQSQVANGNGKRESEIGYPQEDGIILIGCNENSNNVKDGTNRHIRKFAWENEHLRFLASCDYNKSSDPSVYTKLLCMSQDGVHAAIASSDIPTVIRIINPQDLSETYEIETGNDVKDLDFSPNGKVLTYITENSIDIISIVTGSFIVRKLDFDKNLNLSKVKFLNEDKILLISSSTTKGINLSILNVKSGTISIVKSKFLQNLKFKGVTSVSVDNLGQLCVLSGNDNSLALIKFVKDQTDFKIVKIFKNVHTFAITKVAFSPDSKLIASVSAANTVHLIQVPENLATSLTLTEKLWKLFVKFVLIVVIGVLLQVGYYYNTHMLIFEKAMDKISQYRESSNDSSSYFTMSQDILNPTVLSKPAISSLEVKSTSSASTSASTTSSSYADEYYSKEVSSSSVDSETEANYTSDLKDLTEKYDIISESHSSVISESLSSSSSSSSSSFTLVTPEVATTSTTSVTTTTTTNTSKSKPKTTQKVKSKAKPSKPASSSKAATTSKADKSKTRNARGTPFSEESAITEKTIVSNVSEEPILTIQTSPPTPTSEELVLTIQTSPPTPELEQPKAVVSSSPIKETSIPLVSLTSSAKFSTVEEKDIQTKKTVEQKYTEKLETTTQLVEALETPTPKPIADQPQVSVQKADKKGVETIIELEKEEEEAVDLISPETQLSDLEESLEEEKIEESAEIFEEAVLNHGEPIIDVEQEIIEEEKELEYLSEKIEKIEKIEPSAIIDGSNETDDGDDDIVLIKDDVREQDTENMGEVEEAEALLEVEVAEEADAEEAVAEEAEEVDAEEADAEEAEEAYAEEYEDVEFEEAKEDNGDVEIEKVENAEESEYVVDIKTEEAEIEKPQTKKDNEVTEAPEGVEDIEDTEIKGIETKETEGPEDTVQTEYIHKPEATSDIENISYDTNHAVEGSILTESDAEITETLYIQPAEQQSVDPVTEIIEALNTGIDLPSNVYEIPVETPIVPHVEGTLNDVTEFVDHSVTDGVASSEKESETAHVPIHDEL